MTFRRIAGSRLKFAMASQSGLPTARHPDFGQVNKDESRLTMSSFRLGFRITAVASDGVSDAAILEEHFCVAPCATAEFPGRGTFSK